MKTLPLLAALLTLALPAAAQAAPNEGPGTVTVAPDPLVVPATTVGAQGEWLVVDVSYEGEGEAAIDKITIFGEESGEFSANGSDCGTLMSGQHCSAWFALKPTTLGQKQATLEVRFQGDRPAELRTISGRSAPPQLSFAPAAHDFGIQRAGRDSTSVTFQLTNSGEAPVQPNSFDVQGDNSVFWVGTNNCWTLLAPGASCEVQVWFNPNDVREFAGQLRAWVNDSVFTAPLRGRGGRAFLAAAQNPVGFGSLAVGSTAVKTIELSNSGDLPGLYFIAVVAGGDSGSFRLLSESCTMVAVHPGSTCSVRVRFEPQEPGPLAARFALFGDDEPTMVQLEGEGLPAAATDAVRPGFAYETAPRKLRRKRFGRNKGIHAPSRHAARRSELRAADARR